MDKDIDGYIREYEQAKLLFDRYIGLTRDNKGYDEVFMEHFIKNLNYKTANLAAKIKREFE